MKNSAIIIFLLLFIAQKAFSQTATIISKVVFPNERDTVNYIRFNINGQTFGERDTAISIKLNKKGFDYCEAIIGKDTLRFLTKFKANETYNISQGCCCAAFILQAENIPRRGTIIFKNRTNRELALTVAEANYDTVKSKEIKTIFAFESAMCLFKPCPILITETEYLSDKYNYEMDGRNYSQLWSEQETFILSKNWFHFLHGEKIEIVYDDKTRKANLKFDGYLTEKEYQTFMNNP